MENWLVCGSRKALRCQEYKEKVFSELDRRYWNRAGLVGKDFLNSIIEGCCPDSADSYAEQWAQQKGIQIQHHPVGDGSYLPRNIKMVEKASLVIAFWNGYSYGTAQTIAQAVMQNKPVVVIKI